MAKVPVIVRALAKAIRNHCGVSTSYDSARLDGPLLTNLIHIAEKRLVLYVGDNRVTATFAVSTGYQSAITVHEYFSVNLADPNSVETIINKINGFKHPSVVDPGWSRS